MAASSSGLLPIFKAFVNGLCQIRAGVFSWRSLFRLRQSDDERAQIFEREPRV